MKVSLFTPTHDSKFIPTIYEKIGDQFWDEWVILHNGDSRPIDSLTDPRIVQFRDFGGMAYVGRLKREAVERTTGDVLVELDHDDLLLPGCIPALRTAFEQNPQVGFVYSNAVHADRDGKATIPFNEVYGWKYRNFQFEGETLHEHRSFAPTPNAIGKIWFAPNHVRAFRRDSYYAVGGYNADMRILDDLDLMCRLYNHTEFLHVDEPLYLYREHGENTYLKHNAEIQNNVHRIYDQYAQSMALTWAQRKGLRCLNLGGRFDNIPGYENVDVKDAHVICDLDQFWPFENGSVGVIRAWDTLEHLIDPVHTMKEMYRVLAPGGYAFIQVPSTDGRGAFQDPTHVSFWNQNSFLYYCSSQMAKYIDTPVRFQPLRLYTTPHDQMGVCWVRADLLRLDESFRTCGLVEI